jgi:2-oxo-4-hydroxy-4-carboxy-5-ureidoimidazoline decarboxylase
MAERRPFVSAAAAAAAADEVWWSLRSDDWREAFAAHPRIGEASGTRTRERVEGAGDSNEGVDRWAATEQSGVNAASGEVRKRLADGNAEYEARFGYIFIVCATGRSAADMLADLERRLANSPAHELRIAAEEQRNITRLRLEKLLT